MLCSMLGRTIRTDKHICFQGVAQPDDPDVIWHQLSDIAIHPFVATVVPKGHCNKQINNDYVYIIIYIYIHP